jgi:hypothetical protein
LDLLIERKINAFKNREPAMLKDIYDLKLLKEMKDRFDTVDSLDLAPMIHVDRNSPKKQRSEEEFVFETPPQSPR